MKFVTDATCDSVSVNSQYILPSNLFTKVCIYSIDNESELVCSSSSSLNTASLASGVYEVRLEAVLSDASVVNEKGCLVLMCDNYCDLLRSNLSSEKLLYFLALKLANDCDTCSCEDLYKLYKQLTTDSSTTCDCCPLPACSGCNQVV